jgi:hypothetical protein
VRFVKRPLDRSVFTGAIIAAAAVLGAIQFVHPPRAAEGGPFGAIANARLTAGASLNAFGASHQVRLRFALPGENVEFPLEVSGDLADLEYAWVPATDTVSAEAPRTVDGPSFAAPKRPGFYRLAVIRGAERHIIEQPMLAVMVPFQQKVGAKLNGYRIGTYLAERLGYREHPAGFLEVRLADVDLKVSKHLRLRDFLTHDQQADVWPKYVALNPRLLDKLELVLAKIGGGVRVATADADAGDAGDVAFDVHSGYRTPAHNAGVWRAARDSRHQQGDAADVAIDADGDGRVTLRDELLVARAVEQVEDEHPDLVGGLGLYTSRHYRTPYVHIDTRGKRSRWTG